MLTIFLAVALEKRLLVRALISPLMTIIISIRQSGSTRGRQSMGVFFKEACTQLLSAIKTQIWGDELGAEQAIDCSAHILLFAIDGGY